ncbi:MAG: hypothetical protein KBD51_02880 [Candidatus Levybacteria bacterium]|nr:hypothetical protein [Candidatus Levybacteria bacterium]
MKLKKNQKKLILVSIIVALLLVGATAYFKPEILNGLLNQSQSQSTKAFESKYLKFTVDLPGNFKALDESSMIVISSEWGEIYIARNGTQFNNLREYLDEFDRNTSLNFSEDLVMIDNYEAVLRKLTNSDIENGQENIYFIFVENSVFKISTTEEALFDELDLIAKSFKYTGN